MGKKKLARLDSLPDALRAGAEPGSFDLAGMDRAATPGIKDVATAADLRALLGDELADLQERLFAEGRTDGTRSVLLVIQGLDTAGKGGIVRHVAGMVDPQGLAIRSFGVPTPEEREHDFLWRIRKALPPAGRIGVFDRSHYEDVLVARVKNLVAPEVWEARYDEIVAFERELVASGTTIVKVALMVSHDEQHDRLAARLERPDKQWKYNPSDVDTRLLWDDYQEAYQAVLDRTSIPEAPWYVVPADSKDYARLAVTKLLLDALRTLDLGWPTVDYDVEVEKARLAATR
ncbi:PPK2 family polyphosphate kinase [Sanguibacter sp. HDW7]|uniref:PPK2 family polyphosphate kinase n=1 Tax=Sanguibacter sp. HDW7 TaxID=2714931 RepID=UPI00140E4BEC|nr:PPK2 family polyphosphate kinase [Sanguibacter sp. HDW7]QIK83632.1 polyphosphate kinase 2 family protein [Sanguibacter sp. HDW7]